jgi:hypothetical protein
MSTGLWIQLGAGEVQASGFFLPKNSLGTVRSSPIRLTDERRNIQVYLWFVNHALLWRRALPKRLRSI